MTVSDRFAINSLIDRSDRQKQTAFVASIVSYDRDTQTATLKPQHLEVWTATETPVPLPDLDNVPVLFPGASGYSITWDLSPGDFVLVKCTKYSLDLWRQRAEVSDPGDFRKFGLSGAVAEAVRMFANGGETDQVAADGMVIAAPKIYLTSKDAADAVTLASIALSNYNDIKTMLDDLQTQFNAHTHQYSPGPSPAAPTGPAVPQSSATYNPEDPKSDVVLTD